MADSRFFHRAEAASASEIAALTGAVLARGAGDTLMRDVAALDMATADDVSFLDNVRYLDAFSRSKAGACFVREKFAARAPKGMALLITESPYYAFALTAARFYPEQTDTPIVSPHAHIAPTAIIGKNVGIAPGAVIGERVTLADGVRIGAHTVIGDGVEIGDDTQIGSHCSLSHCLIGERTLLHRGIHIGQDGFGFAAGPKGMIKMPQLGRVIIGNDVEIGSGTCIDRGAGPDTIIGNGTKIDNLVQIGHNVQIGSHAVIVAQVGIAGSSRIGDGVMLGGQVGVSGHVSVGKGAKIAAQSGVAGDVPAGEMYGGAPAVPVRDWHRQTIAVAKLVKKKEDD